MKKALSLTLAIAMALSLVIVGFAVPVSAAATNVALNKPAWGSHYYVSIENYPASNAVNGNPQNPWTEYFRPLLDEIGNHDGQMMTVNLRGMYEIDKIRTVAVQPGTNQRWTPTLTYKLQLSNDSGLTWFDFDETQTEYTVEKGDLWDDPTPCPATEWQEYTIATPKTANYVRYWVIDAIKRNADNINPDALPIISCAEFEVYGTPVESNQVITGISLKNQGMNNGVEGAGYVENPDRTWAKAFNGFGYHYGMYQASWTGVVPQNVNIQFNWLPEDVGGTQCAGYWAEFDLGGMFDVTQVHVMGDVNTKLKADSAKDQYGNVVGNPADRNTLKSTRRNYPHKIYVSEDGTNWTPFANNSETMFPGTTEGTAEGGWISKPTSGTVKTARYVKLEVTGYCSGEAMNLFNFEVFGKPGSASTFLYGDVNGDGVVNILDSAYLARHLAGWEGYEIVGPGADVDGNGNINILDSAYLARHLAGWENYEVCGPK